MWIDVEKELPLIDGFYNVELKTDNGIIIHSCWFQNGQWYYDNFLMAGEPLFAMGWYASVVSWKELPKSK